MWYLLPFELLAFAMKDIECVRMMAFLLVMLLLLLVLWYETPGIWRSTKLWNNVRKSLPPNREHTHTHADKNKSHRYWFSSDGKYGYGFWYLLSSQSKAAKGNWITSIWHREINSEWHIWWNGLNTKLTARGNKSASRLLYKYYNFDVELNGDPVAIAVAFVSFAAFFSGGRSMRSTMAIICRPIFSRHHSLFVRGSRVEMGEQQTRTIIDGNYSWKTKYITYEVENWIKKFCRHVESYSDDVNAFVYVCVSHTKLSATIMDWEGRLCPATIFANVAVADLWCSTPFSIYPSDLARRKRKINTFAVSVIVVVVVFCCWVLQMLFSRLVLSVTCCCCTIFFLFPHQYYFLASG